MLIRRAVEQGNSGLANGLLSTIAKLSGVQIANQVRMGQLLEASAVVAIAQRLSEAIALRLAHVPNRDQVIDALTADFAEIFKNREQLLRLSHEPTSCAESQSAQSP